MLSDKGKKKSQNASMSRTKLSQMHIFTCGRPSLSVFLIQALKYPVDRTYQSHSKIKWTYTRFSWLLYERKILRNVS